MLGLYWDYIGVIFGLYWDYIGLILGLYRGYMAGFVFQDSTLVELGAPSQEKTIVAMQTMTQAVHFLEQ